MRYNANAIAARLREIAKYGVWQNEELEDAAGCVEELVATVKYDQKMFARMRADRSKVEEKADKRRELLEEGLEIVSPLKSHPLAANPAELLAWAEKVKTALEE